MQKKGSLLEALPFSTVVNVTVISEDGIPSNTDTTKVTMPSVSTTATDVSSKPITTAANN